MISRGWGLKVLGDLELGFFNFRSALTSTVALWGTR